MKRVSTFTIAALLLVGIQSASSQSFLKKALQAIEDTGKAIGDVFSGEDSPAAVADIPIGQRQYYAHSLKGDVREVMETNVSKGKTSVSVYRFNRHKQLSSVDLSSLNANVKLRMEMEYNPDGSLKKRTYERKEARNDISEEENMIPGMSIFEIPYEKGAMDTYVPDGPGVTEYTYHPNGRTATETTTTASGTETRYYREDGTVSRVVNKMNGNNLEYIYDAKGKLTSQKQDGKDLPLYDDDYSEEYGDDVVKHDSRGRIVSSEGDRGNTYFTYNNNGYISTIRSSDRWWGETNTAFTGYAYDAEGNWTRRTMKTTGGPNPTSVTTTREISYY